MLMNTPPCEMGRTGDEAGPRRSTVPSIYSIILFWEKDNGNLIWDEGPGKTWGILDIFSKNRAVLKG